MFRNNKGFTFTELLIGVSVLAIAIGAVIPGYGMFTPGFGTSRQEAREAQVKSNIHTIQIALERYAVDTGGEYPLILYGGDATDTFATSRSYIDYPPIDFPDYIPYRGDYDALLEYGYLAQYPRNPFLSDYNVEQFGKILTNPGENGFEQGLEHMLGRVNIWSRPRDRSREYIRRDVGGEPGNLMWDISEGQRHAPWPIMVVPEPVKSPTGYVNPKPGVFFQNAKTFNDDFQFWLTPGNFYYYAIFDGIGTYSSFVDTDGDGLGNIEFPIQGAVIGYHLAGYGSIRNPGQDLYNLFGDYSAWSLSTLNDPADKDYGMYVGPDGRRDGVIIRVSDRSTHYQ
jgi:prepilin-type N-terminal cleavage/methylation domain-containing protein